MTNISRSYFRLRPYVFLVKGVSRSALYDLHRRRIYPIPASAAYVIERCADGTVDEMLQSIDDAGDRDIARQYLEQLGQMDFGRYHDDVRTLVPYNDNMPDHILWRVTILSIDLRGESEPAEHPDWNGILQAARRDHGTRQLTVFVRGDAESEPGETALVEATAALRFHHIEVVFPSDAVGAAWEDLATRLGLRIALQAKSDSSNPTYRRLQQARLKVRFCPPAVVPAAISTRSLVCDHASFRRLRHASVHCNSLHIDARGNVFPWALEKHHLVGRVSDAASFGRLMRSDELRRAWTFTKDQVERCRDCEYRYGCPQSYTFRSEEGRVGSAPINCGYDPQTGQWSNAVGAGLFETLAAEERVEQTSRYFTAVSHARNPLPGAYVELLDEIVERAAGILGIEPPSSRIRYYFYPTPEELQEEIEARDGIHVSGLTEYSAGGGETIIRTGYPGHAHEVVHALLFNVNPEPAFFVSEACATILGACWGTRQDLFDAPALLLEGEVRVTGADGEDFDLERCLLYDDKGLFIGPLRREQSSVHATARHFIAVQGVKPFLHSWFHAVDEGGLPRHFYELGGSFFLWLIETRGTERFLEFYRSKQTLRHLEGYYAADVATLAGQWIDFLTAAN
jgi:radical SAM protein with 4Fe4S-binding SPASM domain